MFCGVEIRQVSNANFLGNDSILHRRRELYGLGYIGGLRRFVAAAEHYDQCFTTLNVLHAPFRAKMFAHLDDAVTDRLYIAQLSHHRLTQANIQPLPGDPVFQAIKPSRKSFGTFDRVHGQAVVVWLHTVKCSNSKVSSGLNECKLKGKSEKGPLAPLILAVQSLKTSRRRRRRVSTALFLKLHQQLQRLVVVPGFEQFPHLIDVRMQQEQVVGPGAGAAGALFHEILPEQSAVPGNTQMPVNACHDPARIAVAVDVLETHIAVGICVA